MKMRIFSNMCNGVYRIVINTEDWSEGDIELMAQYGEPLVNVGGEISGGAGVKSESRVFGDEYIRILHGFPYARGFDSRDYGTADDAMMIGNLWKGVVMERLRAAVDTLRSKTSPLPTEEIDEI